MLEEREPETLAQRRVGGEGCCTSFAAMAGSHLQIWLGH